MTGISLWTILGAIIVLVALVVLFFPFIFRIEFRVDLFGANAKVYLFKKLLHEGKKKFKVGSEKDDDDLDDANFAPTYVPSKKKTEPEVPETRKIESEHSELKTPEVESAEIETPEEPAPKVEAAAEPREVTASAPAKNKEKLEALKAAEEESLPALPTEAKSAQSEKPAQSSTEEKPKTEAKSQSETAAEPSDKKSKEKPKLTETEFWTILLTPEFDSTAFWAVKKLVASLLRLFRIKFNDCYVEGLRADYETMGYGAALNGILKSFPFVGAWDLRMDWTRDHELCAQGEIRGSINVFRIFVVVLTALFYGGIVAFKFWRRRARVLKTHELPELGWIRSKIVKMLAEE